MKSREDVASLHARLAVAERGAFALGRLLLGVSLFLVPFFVRSALRRGRR